MSIAGNEIVRAAAKASWSRFVTLLAFVLLITGFPAVHNWLGLALLLAGVTTFVLLAFGAEVLYLCFLTNKK